jgi:hypothetical protein
VHLAFNAIIPFAPLWTPYCHSVRQGVKELALHT